MVQQPSLDFARYLHLAKQNMEYDRREKVYRATGHFKTLFLALDTQTYFNEIQGLATGTFSQSDSIVGTRPPCDVVTPPVRRVLLELLLPIPWAIRDGTEIEVTYQSMRSPDPTCQWIAPHSLAFDGSRWYTRAWRHGTARCRAFVLTKFQAICERRISSVNPQDDTDWQTIVVIDVGPHPNLTPSQRESVIGDFGMQNGRLSKTIRRSLVSYFVRHLRIEASQESQPIA